MPKMKSLISAWLNEKPPNPAPSDAFDEDAFTRAQAENKAWYQGSPAALQAAYESNRESSQTPFWAARGTTGITFRKIHSGLPALIVDTLAESVCNDLQSIAVADETRQTVWQRIAAENNFERLLKKAVKTALSQGDCAFRVTLDPALSPLPIIECFEAERVVFTYERGRVTELTFLTELTERGRGGRTYTLRETYGAGFVRYEVADDEGGLHSPAAFLETQSLEDVTYDRRLSLAVPLLFDESVEFEGRGRSLFEGKKGAFDALDEVISQWVDALRDGRAKTYIPVGLLPRNPHTGAVARPNGFDARFVQTATDMAEGAANRIEVVQANIPTRALADSYAAFLDISLQGVLSPATLGIDLKKTDNATAQREKEKVTFNTRAKLIARLRSVLPEVVKAAVTAWELSAGEPQADPSISISFGEYGSPTFDEQIQTVAQAVSSGLMSTETALHELYGDSWTEAQYQAELARLSNPSL